ncbi:hypothetical protein LXL04_004041 [Taraxacum kok-saghyz]
MSMMLCESDEDQYEVGVSMDKIFRAKAAATKIVVGPLKQGFKACGRDILGFDGAFMKGPFPGQVLTAVGLDSNNGIYPVAYAIIESENMASWKWFLDCLGDDLDLGINSNFTFITDRQKKWAKDWTGYRLYSVKPVMHIPHPHLPIDRASLKRQATVDDVDDSSPPLHATPYLPSFSNRRKKVKTNPR